MVRAKIANLIHAPMRAKPNVWNQAVATHVKGSLQKVNAKTVLTTWWHPSLTQNVSRLIVDQMELSYKMELAINVDHKKL